MSFIKKGLQKAWNFVKKHWKEIVLVAAVVFTAGIATVGAAGFSAAMTAGGGGVGGFFSAVGSTMWAGVTATAGSMGLGSGASGTAASLAGVSGQGLGAAMGWGAAGQGLGMTSAEVASNVAAQGLTPAMIGEKAAEGAVLNGATAAEAQQIGMTAAKEAAAQGLGTGVGEAGSLMGSGPIATGEKMAADIGYKGAVAQMGGGAASTAGMSTGEAMMWSTALSTGGSMLSGYAQGKAMEDQLDAQKPNAYWGVATEKGGRKGGVEDYLFEGAVMTPLAGDVADPNVAAQTLQDKQMGGPSQRAMSGALMTQPGSPVQFAETDINPYLTNTPGYRPLMENPQYG